VTPLGVIRVPERRRVRVRLAKRKRIFEPDRKSLLAALLLPALALPTLPIWAQDNTSLPSWLGNVSGSVRTGYWSRSLSLNGAENIFTGAVWARDKLNLGAFGQVNVDGWAGGPTQVGKNTDGDPFLNDHVYGRLRQFEWQGALGEFDIQVGRQMFFWGRADGINPTDNLTPRDYLQLTPYESDQRFGDFAVSTTYHRGDYALQMIWQPEFQTSLIPLTPIAGVTYGYTGPHATFGQGALKLEHTGGSVDWSASYYSGYDVLPDVAPAGIGPGGLAIGVTNHREQVLGADFSSTIGEYVLRGEIGWAIRGGEGLDAFFQKRSQVALVIGGDRNFVGQLNINLQYWAQKVIGYQSPDSLPDPILRQIAVYESVLANQVDSFEHGVTLRAAYNWANDTWSAETSGIAIFTPGGYRLRSRINHSITDHFQAIAGFEYFNGPSRSIFGYLNKTSTAYCELRYVF